MQFYVNEFIWYVNFYELCIWILSNYMTHFVLQSYIHFEMFDKLYYLQKVRRIRVNVDINLALYFFQTKLTASSKLVLLFPPVIVHGASKTLSIHFDELCWNIIFLGDFSQKWTAYNTVKNTTLGEYQP